MADFDRVQGLPDDEGDEKLIIKKFMVELCRRDDLDNRKMNIGAKIISNVFSTEEIRQAVLGGFTLDRVTLALRAHILKNRDNEPIEFLDNEENVRLTDTGRARCDEYNA